MKHFASCKDYFRFVTAREFADAQTNAPFAYSKSRLEKVGEVLASPLARPGDYVLKNIRNPLFITAAVIVGLMLTTLIFYPAVIPGLLAITSVLKAGAFALTQTALTGLCLRTLGRLNNSGLMAAWDSRQLQPVRLGAIILQL